MCGSGTGLSRTRKRTGPNRTEPLRVRKARAEPRRTAKTIFPNRTEPNRFLPEICVLPNHCVRGLAHATQRKKLLCTPDLEFFELISYQPTFNNTYTHPNNIFTHTYTILWYKLGWSNHHFNNLYWRIDIETKEITTCAGSWTILGVLWLFEA